MEAGIPIARLAEDEAEAEATPSLKTLVDADGIEPPSLLVLAGRSTN